MALDQQFRDRTGALFEGSNRAAELLQDRQVQIGHGPFVSTPLGVVTMLESQGFTTGNDGGETCTNMTGGLSSTEEDGRVIQQGSHGS